MPIGDYCERRTVVAHPRETLQRAARRMRDTGVGSLVVVERSVPKAIATDRDVALAVLCEHRDARVATLVEVASPTIDAIEGDRPVREAMQSLRKHGHRRLAVVDVQGGLQGVVSSDDLTLLSAGLLDGVANAIRAQCPHASEGRGARDLATTRDLGAEVASLPKECSVRDAARAMEERNVGALVVVDNSKPVGIVTDRDLLTRAVAEGKRGGHTPVGAVMSAPLWTVDREAHFDEVVALMAAHGIRRVPIVENEELLGMVSLDDALREIASDLRDLSVGIERGRANGHPGGRARALLREVGEGVRDLSALLGEVGEETTTRWGRELSRVRKQLQRQCEEGKR